MIMTTYEGRVPQYPSQNATAEEFYEWENATMVQNRNDALDRVLGKACEFPELWWKVIAGGRHTRDDLVAVRDRKRARRAHLAQEVTG